MTELDSQFGSEKKIGQTSHAAQLTYVYPTALRDVVRAKFPQNARDSSDPVGPQVCSVQQLIYSFCVYTTKYYNHLGVCSIIQGP